MLYLIVMPHVKFVPYQDESSMQVGTCTAFAWPIISKYNIIDKNEITWCIALVQEEDQAMATG